MRFSLCAVVAVLWTTHDAVAFHLFALSGTRHSRDNCRSRRWPTRMGATPPLAPTSSTPIDEYVAKARLCVGEAATGDDVVMKVALMILEEKRTAEKDSARVVAEKEAAWIIAMNEAETARLVAESKAKIAEHEVVRIVAEKETARIIAEMDAATARTIAESEVAVHTASIVAIKETAIAAAENKIEKLIDRHARSKALYKRRLAATILRYAHSFPHPIVPCFISPVAVPPSCRYVLDNFLFSIVTEYQSKNGPIYEAMMAYIASVDPKLSKDFVSETEKEHPKVSVIDRFLRQSSLVPVIWKVWDVPYPTAIYPRLWDDVIDSALPQYHVYRPSGEVTVFLSSAFSDHAMMFWKNLAAIANMSIEVYSQQDADFGEIEEDWEQREKARAEAVVK